MNTISNHFFNIQRDLNEGTTILKMSYANKIAIDGATSVPFSKIIEGATGATTELRM